MTGYPRPARTPRPRPAMQQMGYTMQPRYTVATQPAAAQVYANESYVGAQSLPTREDTMPTATTAIQMQQTGLPVQQQPRIQQTMPYAVTGAVRTNMAGRPRQIIRGVGPRSIIHRVPQPVVRQPVAPTTEYGYTEVPAVSPASAHTENPSLVELQTKYNEAKDEIEKLKNENETLKKDKSALELEKKDLESEKKDLESEKKDLESENELLNREQLMLNAQLTQANQFLTTLQGNSSANNEYRDKYNDLSRDYDKLVKEKKAIDDELNELQVQLKDLTTKNNDYKSQISDLSTKNDTLTGKVGELTYKTTDLTTKVTELTNKNDDFISKNSVLTSKNDDLSKTITDLNGQLKKAKDDNEQFTNQIRDLQSSVTELEHKHQLDSLKIENFESKTKELDSSLYDMKMKLAKTEQTVKSQDEIASEQVKYLEIEKKNKELNDTIEKLNEKNNELTRQLNNATNKIQEHSSTIETLKSTQNGNESELQKTMDELAALRSEYEQQQEEVDNLMSDTMAKQNENEQIRRDLDIQKKKSDDFEEKYLNEKKNNEVNSTKVESLQSDLESIKKDLKKKEDEVNTLNTQIEGLKTDRDSYKTQLNSISQSVPKVETIDKSEYTLLEEKNKQLNTTITDLQSQLDNRINDSIMNENTMNELKEKYNKKEEEVGQLSQQVADLQQTLLKPSTPKNTSRMSTSSTNESFALKNKIDDLENQLAQKELENASLKKRAEKRSGRGSMTLAKDVTEQEEKIKQLQEQNATLQGKLDSATKQAGESGNTLELKSQLLLKTSEVDDLQTEINECKKQLEEEKEKTNKLKNDFDDINQKYRGLVGAANVDTYEDTHQAEDFNNMKQSQIQTIEQVKKLQEENSQLRAEISLLKKPTSQRGGRAENTPEMLELRDQCDKLEQELDMKTRELERANKKIDRLKKRSGDSTPSNAAEIAISPAVVNTNDADALKETITDLSSQLLTMKNNLDMMTKQYNTCKTSLDDMTSKCAKATVDMKDYKQQVKDLQVDKAQMNAELSYLRENDGDAVRAELNSKFDKEREKYQNQRSELQKSVAELSNQVNQDKMEINSLKVRLQTAESQINDKEKYAMKDKAEQLENALHAQEQQTLLAQNTIDRLKKKIARYEDESSGTATLEGKLAGKEHELQLLKDDYEDLNNRYKTLSANVRGDESDKKAKEAEIAQLNERVKNLQESANQNLYKKRFEEVMVQIEEKTKQYNDLKSRERELTQQLSCNDPALIQLYNSYNVPSINISDTTPLYLLGPSTRGIMKMVTANNHEFAQKQCIIERESVKEALVNETLFVCMKLYGVTFSCVQEPYLATLTDIYPGSLQQVLAESYLKGQAVFNYRKCMDLAVSIADAIDYMQGLQPSIIHGHLCPGNIMVKTLATIEVADLFTSIYYRKALNSYIHDSYAAPELEQEDQGFSIYSDIYSYGMLLADLFTGCITVKTYDTADYQIKKDSALSYDVVMEDVENTELPANLKQLIYDCIGPTPEYRPKILDIKTRLYSLLEGQEYVNCPVYDYIIQTDEESNLIIIEDNGQGYDDQGYEEEQQQ
ncbi:hypothetical protein WA158_004739 [Blastocystis sp. Blastoise]